MADSKKKRALPFIPHPGHLRKQAKARLADLKSRVPALRLADVQFLLAREYGYGSWRLLMMEVTRRVLPGRRQHARLGFNGRFGASLDEGDPEDHGAFFRVSVACQIGFILVALVGVAMVLVAQDGHMLGRLSLLVRNFSGGAP